MPRRLLLAAICLAGCHCPSRSETPRTDATDYESPSMWLCRPDIPDDACHGDLRATELHADGSRTIVDSAPAKSPDVDCFYVYPTVDLSPIPGNHADFSDLESQKKVVATQIARFRQVCNVYAPLYRQATIGTYLATDAKKEKFFGVAYSDVAAAFALYRKRFDKGHKLVIIGHSQGAQMTTLLLQQSFDDDPALRDRLLVAMPIGFYFDTLPGKTLGGTFAHLPVCTSDVETGCVVTYRSIGAGDAPDAKAWPLPEGRQAMCVNPASVGNEKRSLHGTYIPTERAKGVKDVETPYVMVRDLYRARCVHDDGGRDYLEIEEARGESDARPSLIDFSLFKGFIGLHVYDMQLAQDDLIELVRKKSSGLPPSPR